MSTAAWPRWTSWASAPQRRQDPEHLSRHQEPGAPGQGRVWAKAVNRQGGALLGLPAGVVTGPDGAVLLPGTSGSGKSTLTAPLVQAGSTYYSDELALLRDGLQVLPVPPAFCVKQSGVAALAPHYPALAAQPRFHLRAYGKRATYVARAERAQSECLMVGMWPDAARVGALVRRIGTLPCFALCHATSVQALGEVQQVLAQAPSAKTGSATRVSLAEVTLGWR